MKKSLFCIIDASSFIFRAYYAVRPLSNKKGVPTNAVFGFINMILKILEEQNPDYIAVVYDTKHPSFRKDLYSDYKANRSAMPDDLVPQIPYIKRLVETLQLPAFETPGFEADDIIATLATKAAKPNGISADVCIISSDKDLMQLVSDRIYLYDTMKNQKFGVKEVIEKFGVGPELITDYLGIVGDSSDNIPGVKGVGPKGAVSLLQKFHSIENIYAKIDQVEKAGLKSQLEASKELALLSKQLATVKCDMDLDGFSWEKLNVKHSFGPEFFALLEELDFSALAKRFQNQNTGAGAPTAEKAFTPNPEPLSLFSTPSAPKIKPEFACIRTVKDWEKIIERSKNATEIAIDTETDSLHIRDHALVGFSFCFEDDRSYYVPLNHRNPETKDRLSDQITELEARACIKALLAGKKLVGQNLKFDCNILRGAAIETSDPAFDTMICSYVLEPESRHSLDYLADKLLGHTNISFESICGKGKDQIPFSHVAVEKATDYSAEDAWVTWRIMKLQREQLQQSPGLQKVFEKIEMPLVPVLAEIEWNGVCIDRKHLARLSEQFTIDLDRLEKHAFSLAGRDFNLSSPKQLQVILFEELKLPAFKKTKTGYSTDVEVLEKLRHHHELPDVILQHRELSKLKSTYVDVLPMLEHPVTHRVHSRFNQTVAGTGRLSSSDPNLQNIPIRTATGKEVRRSFIASPGHLLLGADYSQIELRVLASMSGDALLAEAFRNGVDVHSLTASHVFSVDLKAVNEDQRRKAKAINFGLIYGKTAFSLAEELQISRAEASSIIETYFARYPTIRSFLEELKERARKTGYSETLFGRRRNIEGIQAKNKMIVAMAERMATNTPIQGTAADLIKIAMIDLYKELKKQNYKSRLILQVHDELVLETPEDEIEIVKPLVRKCMESAGGDKISVPLEVNMAASRSWVDL